MWTCYDPGYAPFSDPYEGTYDGVISTDVLEHIPEEDILGPWDDLFAQAKTFIYAVAACYPAKKIMPDGTNAHCTNQFVRWAGQIAPRRTPESFNLRVLCTQEKSLWSFEQRKSSPKRASAAAISRELGEG